MNYTNCNWVKCQETSRTGVQALPVAVLQIRIQLWDTSKISPYELLYGQPYHVPHIPGDTHLKGGVNLNNYLISLHKTSWDLQQAVVISRWMGLATPAQEFQPGDWVYWGTSPLQSKRRGPFQVLQTTFNCIETGQSKSMETLFQN